MFTLVAILSLAIGIGANSAIFSVVNALLPRSLPYPDPDRLAVLWLRSPGINIPQDWPSPGQFIDIQSENHSFEAMSISHGGTGTLLGLDQPERVEVLQASSALFPFVGSETALWPPSAAGGRQARGRGGGGPQHEFWKRLFNSDPNVVGRSITLNGLGASGTGADKNQFTVARFSIRVPFWLNIATYPLPRRPTLNGFWVACFA
jgi:hypothetical protein